MTDQEEYIKELESRIEELEGVIDTYVIDNSEGRAYMIIDDKGQGWRGGSWNNFTKNGKLYKNPAHLKAALRMHCKRVGPEDYPEYIKNWKVVETATIIIKRMTPKEFLGD